MVKEIEAIDQESFYRFELSGLRYRSEGKNNP